MKRNYQNGYFLRLAPALKASQIELLGHIQPSQESKCDFACGLLILKNFVSKGAQMVSSRLCTVRVQTNRKYFFYYTSTNVPHR